MALLTPDTRIRPSQVRDAARPADGGPMLRDYGRFARRHAAVVAACIGVGLMAGLGKVLLTPPLYSATAEVMLAVTPTHVSTLVTGRQPRMVTIDTDGQLVRSAEVVGAVSDAVGQDPDTVRAALGVTAAPVSRVLRISYTAATPATAATGATTAARSVVSARRAALGALQDDQLRRLSYRLAALQGRLSTQLRTRPVTDVNDPLLLQIAELRERLVDLEVVREKPAEVIRVAPLPQQPLRGNEEVPLTSGGLLGLLAGCLIGGVRDGFRRPTSRSST